jgi:signal-transduction protein with cAMP-binding, CBS, and nucleotidyltransferase domain
MRIEPYFGRPAVCVSADASAAEAAKLMADRKIGSLVATDAAGEPVGLVAERELVARVLATGRDPKKTKVSEIMLREVDSVSPREEAARCSILMRQRESRHLLVRDGGKLAGVVSMRDVIRAVLEEREAEVKQLTSYITGGPG